MLRDHRELALYSSPDDYLFANGAGHSWNPDDLRKRVLYPAMERANERLKQQGVPLIPSANRNRQYGFHIFRHSCGSEMLQGTANLKQTSCFLGHSNIGITADTYLHLQPDSLVEPARKLEEELSRYLCSNVLKTGESATAETVN